MSWIKFRDVSTASLANVAVMKMPSHKKAARRMTEFYVDGRDGALHIDNGMADIEEEAVLVLLDAGAKTRQVVNAWADGTGKLITSDDPSLAYKATVIQEIIWTRTVAASYIEEFLATKAYSAGDYVKHSGSVYEFKVNHAAGAWNASQVDERPWLVKGVFDTAKIRFTCNPYMYEAVDSQVTFNASGALTNPGSAEAYPLIQVNGSGDVSFSINGLSIEIDDMSSNVPVYIDCENGYVYTASGASTITADDFPVIPLPTTQNPTCPVVLGTGITSLVITPHWRWV